MILESTVTRITRICSSKCLFKCFVRRIPQDFGVAPTARRWHSFTVQVIRSANWIGWECALCRSAVLWQLCLHDCFTSTFYLLPCLWQICSPVTTQWFETVTSALYCEYTRLAAPPSSFTVQLLRADAASDTEGGWEGQWTVLLRKRFGTLCLT